MQPVSKTAFYCCGVRAKDAESPHPIVGDQYAKVFMSEEGKQVFSAFADQVYPNGSNVARHRIIDDLIRARLLEDAARPILLIGAGFDTRAFRFRGGRWVEVDEQALIEFKNSQLPVRGSPNPLERIPVDFSRDWLPEVSERFTGSTRVTVVIEGVFGYLEEAQISRLLTGLHRRFKQHEIICDLTNRKFATRVAGEIHEKLAALGARPVERPDDPEAIFRDHGYQRSSETSIILRAAELRAIPMKPWVIRFLLPVLKKGYRVITFDRV